MTGVFLFSFLSFFIGWAWSGVYTANKMSERFSSWLKSRGFSDDVIKNILNDIKENVTHE